MNINDFMKTNEYNEFIKNNPGIGKLKIRSYAASEALPVEGLNIVVSIIINNNKIIFFTGKTDGSGMIPTISLPTPSLISNLEIPNTIKYDIEAYMDSSNKSNFSVNMYDGVCVLQNINFIPGDNYGN